MGKYYCGMLFNDDSLYHYGILGQKWGVRRFQNSDGSLTPEGRIRYGSGKSREQTSDSNNRFGYSGGQDGKGGTVKKRTYIDADNKKVKMTEEEYLKYKNKTLTDMKRTTEKEDHGEKGSVKENLGILGLSVAINASTMNPVGLAIDAHIVARMVSGKVKHKMYNDERNKNPIDKETSVHLKSKEMTEKEDLKRINPEVYDFNTNTKSNCVLCTTAYELRRRGYDVEAKKASKGYTPGDIKRLFPKAKMESFMPDTVEINKNLKRKAVFGINKDYANDVVKSLEKQPNGARGNLFVVWGLSNVGHSMIYEIKDGKMIVMDGQVNKVYKDPVKILKRCTDIRAIRTDNLKLNPKLVKEYVR